MDRQYLIVDDNRPFAENIAEIVRDLGDEATVVEDGTRALELVRRRRFHALVTDMRMPVMGGGELVHAARRLDPGLAAIVITAYVRDVDLDTARREGLLAVLPKPVPIATLLELLGQARRDGLVAVVEDDERLSENLCEALRARGFAAVTARSVLETQHLAAVHPFAALVDIRVPGGPSGEAMLRLAARYPGLPAVVISGFDDDTPVPAAARFHKPFRTEDLLAELERLHAGRGGTRT